MATGVNKKSRSARSRAQVVALPVHKIKPSRAKDEALYLYGVSPLMPLTARPKITEPGIDGEHRVEAIACAGLLCWITRVNANEFAAELNRKMEELEWLAESSVRHQRVVSSICARTTLLPTRFGTVFLSENSLASDIDARKKNLFAAFKRVADADEWGVKVFLTAAPQAAVVDAKSGRDYLEKKAKAIAASGKPAPDEEIGKFSAELQKIASASAHSGKVSSGQQGLQWQASFLLPRSRRKQWDTVLKKYAERWAGSRRIESSGPWPPYSFVE
jgi:Gas vesicle synthesis protein GvpL/GvpF